MLHLLLRVTSETEFIICSKLNIGVRLVANTAAAPSDSWLERMLIILCSLAALLSLLFLLNHQVLHDHVLVDLISLLTLGLLLLLQFVLYLFV